MRPTDPNKPEKVNGSEFYEYYLQLEQRIRLKFNFKKCINFWSIAILASECDSGYFRCMDGICLDETLVLDGQKDCTNGDDEGLNSTDFQND